MAVILTVWELGGGQGHVAALAPLIKKLSVQGHKIVVAMRDVIKAKRAFGRLDVAYYQAPFKVSFDRRPSAARSFADVLHVCGFGDYGELDALTRTWRNLFQAAKPDTVLFNHSPTALLASRELDLRRVLVGTGFEIPPPTRQFPSFRTAANSQSALEGECLANANAVLRDRRTPRLESLSCLYTEVNDTILATYAALDPYAEWRPKSTRYSGTWATSSGITLKWPDVAGKRIYAYLKRSQQLQEILGVLRRSQQPTIAYVDGHVEQAGRQFESKSLCITTRPVNLDAIARGCDVAVLNGGHGTTSQILLAGKPILFLPQFLEQQLTAQRVFDYGAGLVADSKSGAPFDELLEILLQNRQLRRNAARFAEQNQSCVDLENVVSRITEVD